MQPPSLFITGTDTGVGKTVVTALLALRLQAQGINVGVMKPFATGCCWENGGLVSEDAQWLKEITGVTDDLSLINPIRLEEPLAPLVAARRLASQGPAAHRDFMPEVMAAYQELQRRHECVLVEGVGGLLVPLQEQQNGDAGVPSLKLPLFTCADFANLLGLPVVVVARRTLGTINHTALTCQVPLRPPAHFAGLVFCDAHPVETEDVAMQTSPAIIAEMTGLTIWGTVPYLPDLSNEILNRVAQEFLVLP
ncbi:MAG: dethiobiotin synthase [Abitibacteriaceae bacterium]|nr:dethiobiotin synthase [Abditibacteriaceae bacterium]